MAKKKVNKTNKVAFLISGALLLVALILWFVLPAVKWVVADNVTNYTFLQSTFGYKEEVMLIGDVQILKFSFVGLLGLIFLVLALVVCVYHFVAKKSALGDLAHYIVFVLAVVAGVLVLLSKATLQIEAAIINPEKVQLAIGSFVVAPLAIVGGIVPLIFKVIK